MSKQKFDFSGYATKANIECSDGRTIRKDAFKHQDATIVPLVWQHMYNEPSNILGHAVLENREDGVYAYGLFNDTESAKTAKALVKHGDITTMSIHANKLKQQGQNVLHGVIREVSLVLAAANPGALIENVSIAHADGTKTLDDAEALIFTGEELSTTELDHAEGKTLEDIFASLSDEQKTAVYAMISHALDSKVKHSDDSDDKDADDADDTDDSNVDDATKDKEDKNKIEHSNGGGTNMKNNVFDKEKKATDKNTLSHDDLQSILKDAKKSGSLKDAFLAHAGTYGIDDIDILFPDATLASNTPDIVSRNMEWVKGVIDGTTHTPFSRIKSISADITADEARAKGYVTSALKTEEVFGLLTRTTTPTTIYKKQKLDRDDIIDITTIDVVAWLKMEMRMMLDEEIARAVLVSDGRLINDADKISEINVRSIYKDADFYSHKVKLTADVTVGEQIEAVIRARKFYKGTGRPAFYTTPDTLTDMLLHKDSDGRRIYTNEKMLAAELRVSKIVEVEVMEGQERLDGDDTYDLLGIIVNMKDYKIGAEKGGQIAMFDDFDIDYNQHKYLIETRISGALTKPKSALVIEKLQAEG